ERAHALAVAEDDVAALDRGRFGAGVDALAHPGQHPLGAAVVARGRPLVFRRWRPGQTFVAGSLGEPAPPPDAPEVKPELLLVPLLAFDRRGYRLGYGGGYFDRTIAMLRAAPDMAGVGGVLAVGLAYAAQEVPALPTEGHDQRLDWIVTETEIIRPRP
ncbi:MAG TPA: 5-formyltetrahydrofolate cyclo-ligase, partial [Alphaproteobacteria bacterium]